MSLRSKVLFILALTVVCYAAADHAMQRWSIFDSFVKLEEHEAQLLVAVSGLDQDLGQELHASHAYLTDDIVEDSRLADMFSVNTKLRRAVDFGNFHKTMAMSREPLSPQD